MELEQLRIFCTVAACRSFTRAAGQLFVSHSTTSRAVSALERELGVPLLVRDRHTVALTPAGQTLLTGAEDLLRQADALAAAVHTAAEGGPRPPPNRRRRPRSRPNRRRRNFGGLHKLFCKISTFERKTLLTFGRVFAILIKRLCGNRCILR